LLNSLTSYRSGREIPRNIDDDDATIPFAIENHFEGGRTLAVQEIVEPAGLNQLGDEDSNVSVRIAAFKF